MHNEFHRIHSQRNPKFHFRQWAWLRPIKKEMKPVGHFNICTSISGRARNSFLLQSILACPGAHPAHLPQQWMQKEYYK